MMEYTPINQLAYYFAVFLEMKRGRCSCRWQTINLICTNLGPSIIDLTDSTNREHILLYHSQEIN